MTAQTPGCGANSEARKRLAETTADHPTRDEQYADEHDHGPTSQLLDHAWCASCQHTHIATIPATTFRCTGGDHGCGFGAWGATVAAAHAGRYPDHIVYPLLHALVAADPAPTQPEFPGLHACAGCGLELDADDRSTRCEDCTPAAQPDAALSDDGRLHDVVERCLRLRNADGTHKVSAEARNIIRAAMDAARAAQPVPAPEVSRGVAEALARLSAEIRMTAIPETDPQTPNQRAMSGVFREWATRLDRLVRDALPAEGGDPT